MTDSDRLRTKIKNEFLDYGYRLLTGDGKSEDNVNAIQALIAREVRLGRLDELNNLNTPNGDIYSSLTESSMGTWNDRIAELAKESPNE